MKSTYAYTSAARPQAQRPGLDSFGNSLKNNLRSFGEGSTADAKTVNIQQLANEGSATNSSGESVGFNTHELGSEAWYNYGMKHGVWVNGVNSKDFMAGIAPKNNHEKRYENAAKFLDEMAGMLQVFQDELVQMMAAGVPKSQMRAFAKSVMAGGGANDLESMQKTPDAGSEAAKSGIANLYNILLTSNASDIERTLLNNIEEGKDIRESTGMRLVRSMEGGLRGQISETKKSLDIKPVDANKERRNLASERVRFLLDVRGEIAKLPLDQHDAAWAEVKLQLDAVTEERLSTDDVPTTPDYRTTDTVVPYYESSLDEASAASDRAMWEGAVAGAAVAGPFGAAAGFAVGFFMG